MSADTLIMWAVVDPPKGPVIFSNVAEYEAWEGLEELPGALETELINEGDQPRAVLWRRASNQGEIDVTCWIDETKHEILVLQCPPNVEREEGVTAARSTRGEKAVGEVALDGAFVVAGAVFPASMLKTPPSRLMRQRFAGRPMSKLSTFRTDENVGSVFSVKPGVWRAMTGQQPGGARWLWLRWASSLAGAAEQAPAPAKARRAKPKAARAARKKTVAAKKRPTTKKKKIGAGPKKRAAGKRRARS